MLGQNQECYGGCFSPTYSLDGQIADFRIWNRVLSQARQPHSHSTLQMTFYWPGGRALYCTARKLAVLHSALRPLFGGLVFSSATSASEVAQTWKVYVHVGCQADSTRGSPIHAPTLTRVTRTLTLA